MLVSAASSSLMSMIALCLAVAGLWAVQPIFWSMLTKWNERPTTRWVTPRWVTPKRRTLTGRRHQSAQMEDHRGFHRL
ncbi:MAG: hypothetical protein CBARDMAM_6200, partial [uncultured Caballeronia sp.]